jgi:hypothetical protein
MNRYEEQPVNTRYIRATEQIPYELRRYYWKVLNQYLRDTPIIYIKNIPRSSRSPRWMNTRNGRGDRRRRHPRRTSGAFVSTSSPEQNP